MLKLSEIRSAYERSSARLGEINRQLCFAGFAVVWIFNRSSSGLSVPWELYLPLALWCISLSLDVLQYLVKTVVWWLVYVANKGKAKANGGEDKVQINESEWLNLLTWLLFFAKIVCMAAGYVVTIIFIFEKINHG